MEKASSEENLVQALIAGWESAGMGGPTIVEKLRQMIGPVEDAHHSLTADWMDAERRGYGHFEDRCIENEMAYVGRFERAIAAELMNRT